MSEASTAASNDSEQDELLQMLEKMHIEDQKPDQEEAPKKRKMTFEEDQAARKRKHRRLLKKAMADPPGKILTVRWSSHPSSEEKMKMAVFMRQAEEEFPINAGKMSYWEDMQKIYPDNQPDLKRDF